MTKFQKLSIIVILITILAFFSGLFFGYWNVIHYQKISQDDNYYYVEFMGDEYYYFKD